MRATPCESPPRRPPGPWMLEAEIEQLRASPLTSIFILTLLTTVVLRKLYQLQLKLATKKD